MTEIEQEQEIPIEDFDSGIEDLYDEDYQIMDTVPLCGTCRSELLEPPHSTWYYCANCDIEYYDIKSLKWKEEYW